MADLSTLIRLHKHELDEKRLALAGLYTAMAALERQRRDLEFAFEREKEAAANTDDIHFTFTRYVAQVNRQRKKMDEQKEELEKKIAAAKDSMMTTFSELKKYEMTQQERDRLAAEERQMKESHEMDAIGLEGFRRKGEE
jgi:flagellar export protein FliJ